MNVVREEIAFAHTIADIPADPRVRFGGTLLVTERGARQDVIRNMVQGLQPIAQKRDNDEIALLKKILMASVQKTAPTGQTGPNFGGQAPKVV